MTEELTEKLNAMGVYTAEDFEADLNNFNTEVEEIAKTNIEVNINIDLPHIVLDKAELLKVIKLAGTIIKKETADVAGRSINITPKDGKIIYRLTDFATYITVEGSCLNTENVLDETISIPLSLILKLSRMLGSKVPIYRATNVEDGKEISNLYVRLVEGDLLLDLKESDVKYLIAPGTETGKVLLNVDSKDISTIGKSMSPLMADSQQTETKILSIIEDRAVFNNVVYAMHFKGSFVPMRLRHKDLDILKVMADLSADTSFTFKEVDSKRINVVTSDIVCSMSISEPQVNNKVLSLLDVAESAHYINVDFNELYRIVSLAAELSYAVGTIELNYAEDGTGLIAKVVAKRGLSEFKINGNNPYNIASLPESAIIFAKQFKKILQSFQTSGEVQLALLKDGVALKNESITAIMLYLS